MTFKEWWFNEGSQAPYTHHDCEEHCMRMCEIAWSNGAYAEREACAKLVEKSSLPDTYSQECLPDIANEIRARGET